MLLILHTDSQVITLDTHRHKQEQVSKVDNPMLLILHTDSQAITSDTQTQKRTG